MNPAQLLRHFDRIAEAPDAVARLRRLILDLAVRGKLVEQDPRDEPIAEQLKHARRRLKKAAETTSRLRWNPSAEIARGEAEKDGPPGWIAARINDTGLYINGLAFKPSDWRKEGLPIIRIQNLTDPSKECNFAQGEFPDEVLVRNGDILVSWSRQTGFESPWGRHLNQGVNGVILCPAQDFQSIPRVPVILSPRRWRHSEVSGPADWRAPALIVIAARRSAGCVVRPSWPDGIRAGSPDYAGATISWPA
jgi:hypothetical protein